MQLFFNSNITSETTQFIFEKEESRHIIRVLRKKEGDVLHITNGKGYLFYAEITIANDKKCVVNVIKVEKKKIIEHIIYMLQLHLLKITIV